MFEKIGEIFTKGYEDETNYQEYMYENRDCFRLNNSSESIESTVNRLVGKNYVSNFKIEVNFL